MWGPNEMQHTGAKEIYCNLIIGKTKKKLIWVEVNADVWEVFSFIGFVISQ